jgi:uncharacterized phage protein gp47/JayE
VPKSFGLSETGFKAKDLTTIKNDLEADLLREVDPGLQLGPGSVAGMVTGIVANQARQVWEALHGLYHSLQPTAATGKALDELCQLTGTYRLEATKSRAKVMLTLASNAKVPEGSRLQSIGGHSFVIRDDTLNDNPITTDIETECVADTEGPFIGHANTAAKIMTPVAGWSKAVFKHMIEPGRLLETDEDLRNRRATELKAKGSSTVDAIRSRLRQLKTVEAVHIKESSHSFEVVIKGGSDQEIARTIWDAKPLGVLTAGAVSSPVIDSLGHIRIIYFSRPMVIDLALHAKLTVRRTLTDSELDNIKNAVADYAVQHFTMGSEIYPSRFYRVLLEQPQVLDVEQLKLTERSSGKPAPADMKPEHIASLNFNDIYLEQVVETNS